VAAAAAAEEGLAGALVAEEEEEEEEVDGRAEKVFPDRVGIVDEEDDEEEVWFFDSMGSIWKAESSSKKV